MICGLQRRSALFGEEVILLPQPVFEPPTPILYPSHSTDSKHQVPKLFTHPIYVTNRNTKGPTQDNCPCQHQTGALCCTATYCCRFEIVHWLVSAVLSDVACFVTQLSIYSHSENARPLTVGSRPAKNKTITPSPTSRGGPGENL